MSAPGKIPPDIRCAADYESVARRFIDAPAYEYIAGGSGRGLAENANREALGAWAIHPRLLADVTDAHTKLNILDLALDHPIFLAPAAFQKLAHPLGEMESARAAQATKTCMVASTLSTCSLEEIAGPAGKEKWFQLYMQPQRDITRDLLSRAEAAGYSAIVVTLDATIQIPSQRAISAGFQMPSDCVPANLAAYSAADQTSLAAGESRIFKGAMRNAPTWDDLRWLTGQTSLPVLVKGVMHPDDARALRQAGVSGLVVSNHGGRAFESAPASLRALPAIRAAMGDTYPVLMDGGIRSGADIFKAIALGADAVMIGRLQIYALGVAGALGVAHMLRLLREELEICMALAGCASLSDVRQTKLMAMNHSAGEGKP